MTVTATERRARILELVRAQGTLRVADLAARLGQPEVTVRRDVASMTEEGLLHRTHGAVSVPSSHGSPSSVGAVGMLVPTAVKYFDEVIDGARAVAAAAGTRLILGIAPYESADDRSAARQLLESGAQGLLLTPNWPPDGDSRDSAWMGDLSVPVVLAERAPTPGTPAAELDSVSSNHEHGVLIALRHLAALGHSSIALAARRDTWTAHDVRAGYATAVKILGLRKQPVVDIPSSNMEGVADQISDVIARGTRAVLVHNDDAAIQLTSLLRARGVRIPSDLALVSYDDVFATLADPPLTAVAPPKRAVGQVAMELLLRRLNRRDELPTQHVSLLPSLKVRTSCGAEVH